MMRFLYEHLGWKILAVLLAVALWFLVVGDPGLTASVSAPLEFRNIPLDLEINSETPEHIHLQIQGPSGQLQPSALASVAVVLDLGGVHRAGERTFFVDQSAVALPPGVQLVRAVPAQLRLRFEQRARREVPVQVRYSGSPPAGYRVLRQEVNPPAVRIAGPESRVNSVAAAETDPIDLGAVVGEGEFRVHTFIADSHVRFESSPEVVVRVVMEKVAAGARQR